MKQERFWLIPLALFCLVTAIGSLDYIMGSPEGFAHPFTEKYTEHLVLVRTHGLSAALAMILWPLGFATALPYHAIRGRLYVLAVLVGGVTAVPMSIMAEGGTFSRAGFLLLSVLWLYSGVALWRTAVKRDFTKHQIWVIRSSALTFGAAVLRILLHSVQGFGYTFDEVYAGVVWVSWAIAMGVGEFIIEKRGLTPV